MLGIKVVQEAGGRLTQALHREGLNPHIVKTCLWLHHHYQHHYLQSPYIAQELCVQSL